MSTTPATTSPTFDASTWQALSGFQRAVAMVLALGAQPRPRTWIASAFLTQAKAETFQLAQRSHPEEVREALVALRKARWVLEVNHYGAGEQWILNPKAVTVVYPALLALAPVATWRNWLADAYGRPRFHCCGWRRWRAATMTSFAPRCSSTSIRGWSSRRSWSALCWTSPTPICCPCST